MGWLNFVASLVGSMAWPGAVLTIAILLRKPLSNLLQDVRRLKWKDLEVEVGKQVAQARADVAARKPVAQLAEAKVPPASATYFQALAEISPRAALLEAWLPFEMVATRIADSVGLAKPGRALQMPDLLDGLNRERLITDEEAAALGRLRAVRNRVVHSIAADLTPASAVDYTALLQQITAAMEARAKSRG